MKKGLEKVVESRNVGGLKESVSRAIATAAVRIGIVGMWGYRGSGKAPVVCIFGRGGRELERPAVCILGRASPQKREGCACVAPSRVSARLTAVLIRRSVKKDCVWLGEVSRGSDGNAIC